MKIALLLQAITVMELAAAILATSTFRKYRHSKERNFLYFLWFTVTVELLGTELRYSDQSNYWLYNLYMVASFLFYLHWYHTILENKTLKQVIVMFAGGFLCVAVWNASRETMNSYHEFTFVVGAIFTLVCTLFHFWQLLNSDEVLMVRYRLSFWISTGLLLFNMGMIPFMLLSDYFNFIGSTYYVVTIVLLNVLLYGCYIIGFLWVKGKHSRFLLFFSY